MVTDSPAPEMVRGGTPDVFSQLLRENVLQIYAVCAVSSPGFAQYHPVPGPQLKLSLGTLMLSESGYAPAGLVSCEKVIGRIDVCNVFKKKAVGGKVERTFYS